MWLTKHLRRPVNRKSSICTMNILIIYINFQVEFLHSPNKARDIALHKLRHYNIYGRSDVGFPSTLNHLKLKMMCWTFVSVQLINSVAPVKENVKIQHVYTTEAIVSWYQHFSMPKDTIEHEQEIMMQWSSALGVKLAHFQNLQISCLLEPAEELLLNSNCHQIQRKVFMYKLSLQSLQYHLELSDGRISLQRKIWQSKSFNLVWCVAGIPRTPHCFCRVNLAMEVWQSWSKCIWWRSTYCNGRAAPKSFCCLSRNK